MTEILFKTLSYNVIGAAMEVHNTLGPGFLEKVYEAALAHELHLRRIPLETQRPLTVTYKKQLVGEYIADMVVDGKIILELKAIGKLADIHTAQAINYLAATGYELAILLNFGAPRLEHKRVIRRQEMPASNDTNIHE
jgi:GxxExxY protein